MPCRSSQIRATRSAGRLATRLRTSASCPKPNSISQSTAASELRDCRVEYALDVAKPVGASEERDIRLMTNVGRQRGLVAIAYVWRIRDDDVEVAVNGVEVRA